MSSSAVTQDAPAVSEDRLTNFLPTDKDYRLTGNLPAETEDDSAPSKEEEHKETPAVTEGDSAAPDSETDAAPEAATAPEKAGKKTAATSESRWAKLSRENRELRERLARAEGREEGRTASEPRKQESQPATDKEPSIDDVDANGKPKYSTLAEYLKAVREYDRKSILKETEAHLTERQKQQQQSQTEQIIERTVHERAEAARKTHPDYDEVVGEMLSDKDEFGRDAYFYEKGSPIDAFLLDSERSHDVTYEIAQNWAQYKYIFARDEQGRYKLNPIRQLRELAKIENGLSNGRPAEPQAKPVTQAPRPPHQLSGKGSVSKDAVTEAVSSSDFNSYRREQNARELAKRKKG